ncbi:hypothetical protein ACU8V3_13445 [Cobetia marina]
MASSVVWGAGVGLGFSSLDSLLVGILAFLVASALYLLLLYRGVGERKDVESLLIQNADDAVLSAAPQDREEVSAAARAPAGRAGSHAQECQRETRWLVHSSG